MIGKCRRPYYVQSQNIYVPCGHCISCRVAHSREWATRLIQESAYYDHNSFVTLTYSTENLPKNMSISKRVLQLFFKRLRKQLNVKIKYFACGEYGDGKGYRGINPHYHAIIHGIGFVHKSLLVEAWPFGMVHIGHVTYQSARYCAKYILKKYSGVKNDEIYKKHGLETPFQLQSQGIGYRWAMQNSSNIITNLGFTLFGCNVSIPRYYKRKINSDELNQALAGEAIGNASVHRFGQKRFENMDKTQYEMEVLKSTRQSDDTLKAFIALKTGKL